MATTVSIASLDYSNTVDTLSLDPSSSQLSSSPLSTTLLSAVISNATETFIDPALRLDTPAFAPQHALMAAVSVVGLVGNFTAGHVIMRSRAIRRTLSSGFLLNQSLVDFLTCSAAAVDLAVWRWLPNAGLHGWRGTLLCWFVFGRFAFNALVSVSTYNMLALTAERAISVLWPVFHRRRVNKSSVMAGVAGSWFVGVSLISFALPPTSGVRGGRCLNWAIFRGGDAYRRMFGVADLLFTYAIPLVVIAACYYAIYSTVFSDKALGKRTKAEKRRTPISTGDKVNKQQRESSTYSSDDRVPDKAAARSERDTVIRVDSVVIRNAGGIASDAGVESVACGERGAVGAAEGGVVNRGFEGEGSQCGEGQQTTSKSAQTGKTKPASTPTSRSSSRRTSALRTMLSIVACYVICNSLHHLVVILGKFGVRLPAEATLAEIGVVLMFSNAAANPIIYTFQYRDYQRELLDVARGWCGGRGRGVTRHNGQEANANGTGLCGRAINAIQSHLGLASYAQEGKYDARSGVNSSADVDNSDDLV